MSTDGSAAPAALPSEQVIGKRTGETAVVIFSIDGNGGAPKDQNGRTREQRHKQSTSLGSKPGDSTGLSAGQARIVTGITPKNRRFKGELTYCENGSVDVRVMVVSSAVDIKQILE